MENMKPLPDSVKERIFNHANTFLWEFNNAQTSDDALLYSQMYSAVLDMMERVNIKEEFVKRMCKQHMMMLDLVHIV